MKIQILSDLHNEFLRNGEKNPTHKWSGAIPETDADIIILAGDIDTGTRQFVIGFIPMLGCCWGKWTIEMHVCWGSLRSAQPTG